MNQVAGNIMLTVGNPWVSSKSQSAKYPVSCGTWHPAPPLCRPTPVRPEMWKDPYLGPHMSESHEPSGWEHYGYHGGHDARVPIPNGQVWREISLLSVLTQPLGTGRLGGWVGIWIRSPRRVWSVRVGRMSGRMDALLLHNCGARQSTPKWPSRRSESSTKPVPLPLRKQAQTIPLPFPCCGG